MNDDDVRPASGAEDEAAQNAGDAPQAGGDAPQAPEAPGVQDPAGDAGPQAAAPRRRTGASAIRAAAC